MKTALVLSGGAFASAFQFGAIRHLVEEGVEFDFIAGISAGALNGAMLATGNYDYLVDMWKKVEENGSDEIFESKYINLDTLKLNFKELRKYFFSDQNILSLLTKGGKKRFEDKFDSLSGLTTSIPLQEKLKQIELKDFKIPFLTSAVSLVDGQMYTYTNKDFISNEEIRKFIEASATMPVLCPPVDNVYVKGKVLKSLVDGGIRSNLPLGQTIDYIKQTKEDWRIIVINCSSGITAPSLTTSSVFEIGARSLMDISLNQIFKNDLKSAEIINNFVKASKKKELNGYRYYPITVISPDGVNIGSSLKSDTNSIKYRIEQGNKIAKQIWS